MNVKKSFVILVVLSIGAAGLYAVYARTDSNGILRECADASNKPLCYSTYTEDVLRTSGIAAAFDALAVAYDSDPAFAGTCHAVTHELGEAAYEEFNRTERTELTSKAYYCGYGFYHGFMDALVVDTNNMEEARAFCEYVGKNVPHPPPPQFAEGSCYHGIGHGITDGTDPRLWGDALSIVRPGLALCAKVASWKEEWHSRCASGVFNALGNMYLNPQYKLSPGVNPYTLCRTGDFTPLEREQCYSQMNTRASDLGHGNLEEIVAFTNTIGDARYRSVALHEAVSYYVQILKLDQKSIQPQETRVCELPTNELRDSCIGGFVSGIIEFGSPGLQYKEVLDLCSADTLPRDMRLPCFTALLKGSSYFYTSDVQKQICEQVPPQYRNSLCTL